MVIISTSGSDSEDDEFSWKTKKVLYLLNYSLNHFFVTSKKGFQKKEGHKRFTKEQNLCGTAPSS